MRVRLPRASRVRCDGERTPRAMPGPWGMPACHLAVGDVARILSPFIQRGRLHDHLTILA
jgi:hypothetical protein